MDSRPAWGVELFNSRYDYFCFEPIVIFVFLDFVLYEYSSFSSSQEFFSAFWNLVEPFKSAHFSLNLGTKILANIGTQQSKIKLFTRKPLRRLVSRQRGEAQRSADPTEVIRRSPEEYWSRELLRRSPEECWSSRSYKEKSRRVLIQ